MGSLPETTSIPQQATVLVAGGGPAGSYAACLLAREGINVVLLEAENFPRYHVGESMLPSLRTFLRFIDLDSKFQAHGFTKKVGAAFKMNQSKREGWTDFLATGGPEAYTWNVVRSESDNLLFRHAGECGAKIFDGVKVESIEFDKSSGIDVPEDAKVVDIGRPTSAAWKRKDGTTGSIKFDYFVDASGRAGLVSTKYMKNRSYNKGLKNVANWGYWKGTDQYSWGTKRQNSPYFEALTDRSGWAWCIPLHNETMSVGIVMRQDLATEKKKAMGSVSPVDSYKENLKLAPNALKILGKGELVTELKYASDWSYSASAYSSPYVRIAGDAGCFLDPYFSSGVHLAYASGLSAAMTICASLNGDCDELSAAKWHSNKVTEGYTRFLLVVMVAMRQIRGGDEHVLSEWDDDGFDTAFDAFRPVIQGTADADTGSKITRDEVDKTLDFCLHAFKETSEEDRQKVLAKVAAIDGTTTVAAAVEKPNLEKLTEEDQEVLNHIRAKQLVRMEDMYSLDNFGADNIDGLAPRLKRGSLGLLAKTTKNTSSKLDVPVVDLLAKVEQREPTTVAA